MFVYLSVFVGKVSLITEPIWFSITVKILSGPEKLYNYLGASKKKSLLKKITYFFLIRALKKIKVDTASSNVAAIC